MAVFPVMLAPFRYGSPSMLPSRLMVGRVWFALYARTQIVVGHFAHTLEVLDTLAIEDTGPHFWPILTT